MEAERMNYYQNPTHYQRFIVKFVKNAKTSMLRSKNIIAVSVLLKSALGFGQIPNLPTPQSVGNSPNSVFTLPKIGMQSSDAGKTVAVPQNFVSSSASAIEMQNRKIMEADFKRVAQEEEQRKRQSEYEREAQALNAIYNLPSFAGKAGTQAYYDAFGKLSSLNADNYSLTEANFIVENAYYDNKLNYSQFKAGIDKTASQLFQKMKSEKLDTEDNTAKNIMLFKYFSQDTKLKSGNTTTTHKAFQYDFNDPWGAKDYSKMFVTKLLKTGTGQCHSLPLYYLMLAEAMNTEAYLALAPSHSYIRFPDDEEQWKNIELTNGMFSMDAYLLESGYIKSEALQNQIYMSNLSKKELLAQTLSDLAGGYVHKFGYDDFIDTIVSKALELNPNSTSALMYKANTSKMRFEHTAGSLGIDLNDNQQFQQIGRYPLAVAQYRQLKGNAEKLDQLGFEFMPQEVYEGWLSSMKKEENRQNSELIAQKIEEANRLKQKQKLEAMKKAEEEKKKQAKENEQPKYFKIDPSKL